MMLMIKPQQRSTWWHWSVLTLVGLSVTYSWLWVLTYRPIHQPDIEIEMGSDVEGEILPLSIVLEAPQATIEPSTSVAEESVEQASTSSAEPASMAEPPPAQVEAVAVVETITPPPTIAPKLQAPAPVPVRERAPPTPNRSPIIAAAFKTTAPHIVPPTPSSTPVDNTPTSTPTENLHSAAPSDHAAPTPAVPSENSVATNTVKPTPPAVPTISGMEPVPVSRLTRTPTFVHKELPTDPEDVQIPLGGVRVIARITLDETAAVRDVQIDKSGEPPFDVAVISAIHRSRFTPGYVGDQPVATVFNQTYRFQLQ